MGKMYLITDYGAKPEAGFLNTAAIQAAIDACNAAGGGTVIVPPGTFTTGTIWMKSNVELHLEHGALLQASTDLKDYNALDAYPQNYSFSPEEWLGYHLIIGHEIENAAITGSGRIDGSGNFFFEKNTYTEKDEEIPDPLDRTGIQWRGTISWRHGFCLARDKELLRPGQMIVFVESRNILVEDVTMTDSPCWTLFLFGCDRIRISGVQIHNANYHANTDGIDLDCCKNAVVTNCMISTGDDCLTLRSCVRRLKHSDGYCENIAVSNCVFECQATGVRIGVGTGNIRNAVFSNIQINSCGVGFHLQSSYGSGTDKGTAISKMRFENINVLDAAQPIIIAGGTPHAQAPLTDITFAHCSFESFHSLYIGGSGKTIPERITLDDVELFVVEGPKWIRYNIPPVNAEAPEYAVKIADASDVRFRSVRVHWKTSSPWWKDALFTENVQNFSTDDDCVLKKR